MATVELRGVVKRFADQTIVHGVDLAIDEGEFVVLVGPSGCGKSTLLRMIAGLESISAGELLIGGRRANELPPQRRNISMVFQSYALYPHMTAFDNIAYGPRLRGEPAAEVRAKVENAAGILNLFDYLDRLPRELSGGQRQRIAMGRAIVRRPDVFLFDEPLSNLDAKLRVQMRTEIKALHQRVTSTVVYVTHDQVEAMTMADRIVVLNQGRIEQVGTPLDLYDHPDSLFVAGFLGSPAMSLIEGRIERSGGGLAVAAGDGTRLPAPDVPAADGQAVVLGVRPEHWSLAGPEDGVALRIDLVEPTGAEIHLFGAVGGNAVTVTVRDRRGIEEGDTIFLRPLVEAAHLFDAGTGRRL